MRCTYNSAAVVRPPPLPPHGLDGYRDQKPERDESPHGQGFIHRQKIHHFTRPLEVSIGTEYHAEQGWDHGPHLVPNETKERLSA